MIFINHLFSIADLTNYGNEKDAFDLLYPNQHNFKGLENKDLDKTVTKEELKNILIEKNYPFNEKEFEFIYNECVEQSGNQVTFKQFIEKMRKIKREYDKYKII